MRLLHIIHSFLPTSSLFTITIYTYIYIYIYIHTHNPVIRRQLDSPDVN